MKNKVLPRSLTGKVLAPPRLPIFFGHLLVVAGVVQLVLVAWPPHMPWRGCVGGVLAFGLAYNIYKARNGRSPE